MRPFLSIEDEVECFVAPDENVLAAFSKCAVQTAFGDPLVYRPYAQTKQIGELSRRENDGNLSRGAI